MSVQLVPKTVRFSQDALNAGLAGSWLLNDPYGLLSSSSCHMLGSCSDNVHVGLSRWLLKSSYCLTFIAILRDVIAAVMLMHWNIELRHWQARSKL